jgi:hypothetical protein
VGKKRKGEGLKKNLGFALCNIEVFYFFNLSFSFPFIGENSQTSPSPPFFSPQRLELPEDLKELAPEGAGRRGGGSCLFWERKNVFLF